MRGKRHLAGSSITITDTLADHALNLFRDTVTKATSKLAVTHKSVLIFTQKERESIAWAKVYSKLDVIANVADAQNYVWQLCENAVIDEVKKRFKKGETTPDSEGNTSARYDLSERPETDFAVVGDGDVEDDGGAEDDGGGLENESRDAFASATTQGGRGYGGAFESPEQFAIEQDARAKAFAKLTITERWVLTTPTPEVAKVSGWSANTIDQIRHRARQKIS